MTDTTQDPSAAPVEFSESSQPAPSAPAPAPDYASLSLHKIALIAGLAIATVLPNLFISNLIEERETRQTGVRQEFTRNWGPEQSLYGPVLVIPFVSGGGREWYQEVINNT